MRDREDCAGNAAQAKRESFSVSHQFLPASLENEEKTMRNKKVLIIAEIALATALAAVLGLWQITLPINIAGGSISLAMLPVLVLALRRGPIPGAICGALYGSLDLIMGKAYILHWAQVLLDYPLPYLVLGLGVGLFSALYLKQMHARDFGKASLIASIAIVVGGLLRFICHTLSGVIFFASYAGDMNVWVYSLGYNATYLVPSLIITLVLALLVLPALQRAVPVSGDDGKEDTYAVEENHTS